MLHLHFLPKFYATCRTCTLPIFSWRMSILFCLNQDFQNKKFPNLFMSFPFCSMWTIFMAHVADCTLPKFYATCHTCTLLIFYCFISVLFNKMQHRHSTSSGLFAIAYLFLTLFSTVGLAVLWFLYSSQEADNVIRDIAGFAVFACLLWTIYPCFLLFDYRGAKEEKERTLCSLGIPFVYCFIAGLAYVINPTMPSLDRPLVCVAFGVALLDGMFLTVLVLLLCNCIRETYSSHKRTAEIIMPDDAANYASNNNCLATSSYITRS